MAELCLVFLNEYNQKTFRVRAPGACHHVRWMAKVIYFLKIYIFQKELNMSTEHIEKLEKFCLFSSVVYVKAWFNCSNPNGAAKSGFKFV